MVLKVLKVYRLRCFKKAEILNCGLYADNNKTILLYTYKEEEDSKKEKNNYKLYFEIKIDTLMIGARKCQVNQVEREFCSTALTREDIADLF